jgi:ubiquinone/menaquinone biosynthesis C-methylase UbiE
MHQASLTEEIGRQFRHPTGTLGGWMGRFMRLINRRANRFAIEALAISPDDHVLELGFGPGDAVATMARLAHRGRVSGIDRSEVMLAQAKRRNSRAVASGQVKLGQADFASLPLASGSIDKVLAVNVIYFWNPGVAAEVCRVMRPGGMLALYATDESVMRHWAFAGAQTHRLFNANGIEAMLSGGGFAPADITIRHVDAGMGVRGLIAVARKPQTITQGE